MKTFLPLNFYTPSRTDASDLALGHDVARENHAHHVISAAKFGLADADDGLKAARPSDGAAMFRRPLRE